MNIILTSGPKFYIKKADGTKKAIKLENKELVEQLKLMIPKYNNLLFICSNPDDYEVSEEYASLIEKSLSLSGIKFDYTDLLDSRNWLFTKSLVSNSDLIILMGGDPLDQMEFFNDIELKEKIKKINGCVMGISAGSINLANNTYCSKDETIEETLYYKGLGLTNINIEPHFDVNDKSRINDILLIDSKKREFVALEDESFITIKNKDIKLYNEGYLFKDGSYKKIKEIQ